MRYYAISDLGKVRKNNEDSYYIPLEKASIGDVVIVADGLGGHKAGDVASALAIECICDVIAKLCAEDDEMQPAHLLRRAIRAANEKVYRKSREDVALNGMGTTLTMALLTPSRVYLGHIGDSRAYLIRGENISQISVDHTVLQAAVRSGEFTLKQAMKKFNSHMITRALGIFRVVEPDVQAIPWETGDKLVLCSDGLTSEVPDNDILLAFQTDDIRIAADALVKKALANGGNDNITVVCAYNTGKRGVEV